MYVPNGRLLCPYCESKQMWFSLLPIRENTRDCKTCGRTYRLTTRVIAEDWCSTIGLWAALPVTIFALIFQVVVFWPKVSIGFLLLTLPLGLVVLVFVAFLVIPVGIWAGVVLARKPVPGRKYRTIIREVDNWWGSWRTGGGYD